MSRHSTIKDLKNEQKLFQRRVFFAAAISILLTLLLIYRLIYLQILQNIKYETLSQQNQLELLPIAPNRGLIYDRNGILLAENIPIFSLDLIPDHVRNFKKTIEELKKIIPITKDEIRQFYKTIRQHPRFEPTPLKLRLTKKDAAKFYVNQYRFPGVVVNARLIRRYPLKETTTVPVGYVGRINARELFKVNRTNYSATNFIGKDGIEKYYEKTLHGTIGYQQVEIDAGGHIIRTLKRTPPIPGSNLYLTIDSKLQTVAKKALKHERGAAIAIQPKTGEILAIVSNPSFDPNLFAKGISSANFRKLRQSPDKPMFNRSIKGQFAIASTIKPFIALEGLDTKTITPDYTIYDPGWFQLPHTKHIYRDWNWRKGGHGFVDVTKAITVSCDPFFYKLAVKLGIEKVDDILSRFGFGRKTGIDLPNEMTGLVSSPAWKTHTKGIPWYTGDTVISGIGQGYMLTTPIQLAVAATALANRGLRFRPHLLQKKEEPNHQSITQKPLAEDPVMLNHQEPWGIVINAMQKVITSAKPWGTARIRFGTHPGYTVAAKTGTGQVYSHSRDENELTEANVPKRLRNNTLFIAFAPVKHPKIAVAVIVENSLIAGTVARKMLDYYLLKKVEITQSTPNSSHSKSSSKKAPQPTQDSSSEDFLLNPPPVLKLRQVHGGITNIDQENG